MKDWKIAQAAEKSLQPVTALAEALGMRPDEMHPYGHHTCKVDYLSVLERLEGKPEGKYVDVTTITPTPLGGGKTTTTIGLVDGLASLGHRATGAIRQPSGGPTFNIKGRAAGDIKLLPGTSSKPAFRNIDVDTETGQMRGLF